MVKMVLILSCVITALLHRHDANNVPRVDFNISGSILLHSDKPER